MNAASGSPKTQKGADIAVDPRSPDFDPLVFPEEKTAPSGFGGCSTQAARAPGFAFRSPGPVVCIPEGTPRFRPRRPAQRRAEARRIAVVVSASRTRFSPFDGQCAFRTLPQPASFAFLKETRMLRLDTVLRFSLRRSLARPQQSIRVTSIRLVLPVVSLRHLPSDPGISF